MRKIGRGTGTKVLPEKHHLRQNVRQRQSKSVITHSPLQKLSVTLRLPTVDINLYTGDTIEAAQS